jgi:hypothetical protein
VKTKATFLRSPSSVAASAKHAKDGMASIDPTTNATAPRGPAALPRHAGPIGPGQGDDMADAALGERPDW